MNFKFSTAPKTIDEARMMVLLCEMAETASTWLDIYGHVPSTDLKLWFAENEIELPKEYFKETEAYSRVFYVAMDLLTEKLMDDIENYNRAREAVAKDTRPRREILLSEGYNFETGRFDKEK